MKYLWTTIYVKNLDESIAFYADLAELKLQRRFPAGPGMELAFLGNGVEGETLVELITDGKKGAVEHGEFVSIGFAVASLEAMLEKVRGRNVPVQSGPFETPGARFFCVKDPNGFVVQFFQQK